MSAVSEISDDVRVDAKLGVSRASLVYAASGAVFVAIAALWALLARGASNPWIFPDELIYAELAKSLGEGRLPAVRGEATFGYGILYPALLAPLWAAFESIESAYSAALVLNAVVMTSTAVPAYFLARRFVARRAALLVASFSVLVPSMAYTGTLMTEVALYPTFTLAVASIAAALDRPSWWRQVLVFGAIGLAFAAKASGALLLPAYACAIVLAAALECDNGGVWSRLTRFRTTWIAFAAGVATMAVVAGGHPASVLGVYGSGVSRIDPLVLPWRVIQHVAVLDLYVMVVPLAAAALVVVGGVRRTAESRDRLYAVVALAVVGWTIFAVSLFAAGPVTSAPAYYAGAPLLERNVFVVLPLLLTGFAILGRSAAVTRSSRRVAVVVGIVLLATLPWATLQLTTNPHNLAVTLFLVAPGGRLGAATSALAIASAVCLIWIRSGRHAQRRGWMAAGWWFGLVGLFAVLLLARGSEVMGDEGRASSPGWIDAAVGSDARVAVLWREDPGRSNADGFARPDEPQAAVFVNEFYNRSVGPVYSIGARLPYALPDELVALAGDAVVRLDGRPLRERYVLAHCSLGVRGLLVAADAATEMRLVETTGPVGLAGDSC